MKAMALSLPEGAVCAVIWRVLPEGKAEEGAYK